MWDLIVSVLDHCLSFYFEILSSFSLISCFKHRTSATSSLAFTEVVFLVRTLISCPTSYCNLATDFTVPVSLHKASSSTSNRLFSYSWVSDCFSVSGFSVGFSATFLVNISDSLLNAFSILSNLDSICSSFKCLSDSDFLFLQILLCQHKHL